ncbi:MAG: family 16 glycoside hydrolase, partial [Saprospiraceae bacterium]
MLVRCHLLGFLFLIASQLSAQQSLFSALQWRCIGPHRGGRTVGACGIADQPNVFYIGVNNGGVWKTTDAGRTWLPIFDDQSTGSIGDVAVAPSNPKVVYVASGEGIQRPDLSVGNGMYKSTDAGQSWQHLGLADGQQIGGIAVDPTNENRVFAAVLGHPYGANAERGVYRSVDGGQHWEKVLYVDENTGAMQVTIDPKNPQIVYADLFETRLAPWENGKYAGAHSGLYKSTDGGSHWKPLTAGLPTIAQGLGRIGFCLAESQPNILYATVDAKTGGGIYRSDDGGESWQFRNDDARLHDRGDDFAEIKADPKDPDIVYTACEVTWKSTDGGHSWAAWRGAPGGDDYHRIWINPLHPEIILLASDQGAIITVNGGNTFSSWYNQPTAQFYHVSTDNAFPYNVYGGQQESGSVGIASRGNDGQITFREWHPVGAEEYGYVAADPLHSNLLYGGKLSRYDRQTGQTQNVAPEAVRSGQYRFIRTAPVLFSPVDPRTLYFAGNMLFKTQNGGHSWSIISPDLSREKWDIPANVGNFNAQSIQDQRRRGVIYALAPSQQDTATIWAGTDDGLIHLTRDGGQHWKDITPPEVTPWSKVSQLEAGHFDNNTCYAAINRIRLDDQRPHILRTHDGGRSWQEMVTGLPNEPINTLREDPQQPGLLFAGSENAVYVSFDDGGHWQSLRLNMPATSIRDLVIKDDDIVVGTHGRSFWILDNITALRSIVQAGIGADGNAVAEVTKEVQLFQPQSAIRVRWNLNTDTPLPQEEPGGQNPPDGAIIDYYLPKGATGLVKLEIFDAEDHAIRTYTNEDLAPDVTKVNIPLYWIRPQQQLSGTAGSHRFCWDMHYEPLPDIGASFPISAIYGQTEPEPSGPWVLPGNYKVRLTVDEKSYEQPLVVRMDPRVTTSAADLAQQHELSLQCGKYRYFSTLMGSKIKDQRARIAVAEAGARAGLTGDLKVFDQQLAEVFRKAQILTGQYAGVFDILQSTDLPPTRQAVAGVESLNKAYLAVEATYDSVLNVNDHLMTVVDNMAGPASHPIVPPINHASADDPDYQPLFDLNLSNASYPQGVWSMKNGELTATKDECIWTIKEYDNFVLDLEFKTAEGTNSGVIVHCSNTDDWIPNSVEIQIADDYSEEWSKAPATWQCGAIFGHLAATRSAVKHPGEWNRYTITCYNREIWVLLNGEPVNHMDMNRWLSAT